jgi:hypothetical protein
VKLLKGVVGQDQGPRLLGDAQDEAVPPTDGSGRRADHLAVLDGLLERRHLGGIDPMAE